jgi:RNA polymerase sigma-70 factor (ECF subfamily)
MYNADLALEIAFQVAGKGVRSLATDPDAEFSALVQRQSRFVFRVAYAVLLNSYDAEDAVQETFLKLYRNGGWKQADNERAFLARVAWRTAVDLKRRLPPPSTVLLPREEPASSRSDPEETAAKADEQARVHAIIDSLAEELRLPLVLSAFEELNSPEIGKILDIPEGTVRTRLQRARQMLRAKLISLKETRYA